MALIYTEGFDSYSVTADLLKKWTTVGSPWTFSSSAGRGGGGGVTCAAGAGTGTLQSNGFFGGTTTGINHLGFYFKLSAPPSSETQFCKLIRSTDGLSMPCFNISASGTIVYKNTGNSTIGTGIKNVCDNQWHWFENSMRQTTALQVAYVDGIQDFSLSTNWTFGNALGSLAFVQNNLGMSINGIDDIIVYDDNGNSPKESDFPLGARLITTLRPNADSVVQFNRSSGANNYALVNETVADDDSSYVQDNVSGHQDLYDFGNLGYTPGAINGVFLTSRVENTNPGSVNFKLIAKSSSTQTDGTSQLVPTSYTPMYQEFGVDPATSAAWTQSALDAAKFGIKVV